jgi:hypothetical protein
MVQWLAKNKDNFTFSFSFYGSRTLITVFTRARQDRSLWGDVSSPTQTSSCILMSMTCFKRLFRKNVGVNYDNHEAKTCHYWRSFMTGRRNSVKNLRYFLLNSNDFARYNLKISNCWHVKNVCRYVYDPFPYNMSHASSTSSLVIVIKLEGKYRFCMTLLHSTLPPPYTNQRKRTTMKLAYFSKTWFHTKISELYIKWHLCHLCLTNNLQKQDLKTLC